MKFGLLGLIQSDLSDVDFNKIRFATDLGFHGLGAHLTLPADQVSEAAAERARSVIADQGLGFQAGCPDGRARRRRQADQPEPSWRLVAPPG